MAKTKAAIEHTARLKLVLLVNHPVTGRTLEEALVSARAVGINDVVEGLDVADYTLEVQSVDANFWLD